MDVPGRLGEGRSLSAPVEGVAPIAIIDFLANAESVVASLGEHTCVEDWILARCLGDEWVVLAGHGRHGYRPGDVLDRPAGATEHLAALASAWADDVVVDLTEDAVEPRRGQPPSAEPDDFDGLVAFPLWGGDGLFGAICALPVDPVEEAELRRNESMVRLTVELLTSVLGLDLDRSRLQRRLDAAESAALSDPMTGLGNRRAFERAVDREEARCARFGHHGAGDDLIRRAGEAIRNTLRSADQAFRIGGDEFALLLPEVTVDGLGGVRNRLAEAMAAAGVAASMGSAIREPAGSLHASVRAADAAMYESKRSRPLGPGRRRGRIRG
jgi:GGDEF domain-containing protein